MPGFKLLFKNNFKNTIKNKIQFVGLVVLVFLTCFIFTIIEVSKQRIQNVYDTFILEKVSNQHDFITDFSNTNYVKNTTGQDDFISIANIEARQNAILEFLHEKTQNTSEEFYYNRIEARTFNLGNNKVIKAVTLNPAQMIDKFIVSTGMPIDFYASYLESINNETMHWVYLTPEFAKKNNIQINDIVRLQSDSYGTTIKVKDSELKSVDLSNYVNQDINKWLPNSNYSNENWFRVVGFGQSADYVTPIIDSTRPFPNMKDEGIAYLNPKLFGLINTQVAAGNGVNYNVTELDLTKQILIPSSQSEREIYYVGKFRQNVTDQVKQAYVGTINSYINSENGQKIGLNSHYTKTLLQSTPVTTFRTDARYPFATRITYFTATLNAFISGSYLLIAIILITLFFVLILVVRRQIQATGPQNGLLRALGYRHRVLTFSYISYPLMIALIGGVIGYLCGIFGQFTVKYIFGSYFNLPYGTFVIAPFALVTCVLAIFVLLTIVTMISGTIMMVSRTPLQLIRKEQNSSSGKFKEAIKRIFSLRKTFDARFQAVQLSNSLGKMAGVSLTMIISTILITISTTIPIILQNNTRYSYEGNNYQTLVEYNSPIYNLPTSFLKTYDPTQKAWDSKNANPILTSTNMTNDVNQYLTDFETGQINSENYAPSYEATDMRSLLYANISKEFLKSNKLNSNPNIAKGICSTAWTDYKDYGLVNLDKTTIQSYLSTTETARDHITELENYRLFYWKYRDTVALDITRPNYFDSNGNLSLDDSLTNDVFTQTDYLRDFSSNITAIPLDDYHLRSSYEQPLATSFSDTLDSATGDVFNRLIKKPMYDLFNWIYAYFVNNINQCFTQGVYSRSPQNVRTTMKKTFADSNSNFNLSFGVVPYAPIADDRGTMLNAEINDLEFKIYGIDASFKNQALISNKGHEILNSKLYNANNSIVINTSLAKLLGVSVGDDLNASVIKKVLAANNNTVDPDSILNAWDESDVTGTVSTSGGDATVGKLMFNGDNKYKNSVLKDNTDEEVLKSNINPTDPSYTSSTILNNKIVNSEYIITNQNNNQNFKIVGITNQYGAAKAWINEETAEKLLGYDQTRNHLLQLFLNEWSNSFVKQDLNLSSANAASLSELESFITTSKTVPKNQLWANFVEYWKNRPSAINWISVFKNEYPIFNYKISNRMAIDDITSGLGTTQLFGDYSFYGLNGGTNINTQVVFPAYSNSAFDTLLPIEQAKGVLENIASAVSVVIICIITISFILSFMIIILTSNIVIAENQTIIATMKVLGYRNRYITKLVIGMYIPIIIIMTIAGFGFGWLFLQLGGMVLVKAGLVLPIIMNIAIPFIAIGSGLLLYFVAYLISWFNMNRINPLIAIMSAD